MQDRKSSIPPGEIKRNGGTLTVEYDEKKEEDRSFPVANKHHRKHKAECQKVVTSVAAEQYAAPLAPCTVIGWPPVCAKTGPSRFWKQERA